MSWIWSSQSGCHSVYSSHMHLSRAFYFNRAYLVLLLSVNVTRHGIKCCSLVGKLKALSLSIYSFKELPATCSLLLDQQITPRKIVALPAFIDFKSFFNRGRICSLDAQKLQLGREWKEIQRWDALLSIPLTRNLHGMFQKVWTHTTWWMSSSITLYLKSLIL